MRIIVIVSFILITLYIIYGLFVYLSQREMIFQGDPLPKSHVFKFDSAHQNYEELNIEADDGTALNSLLFKADDPKGIIVYFHGNASNNAMWGNIAETYLKRGYHLLLWDYRGYGKTKGKITFNNIHRDSETVYEYASEKYPDLEIIPYGVSLGCALAIHVANKYQSKRLILETPFFSMKRLAAEHFPGLPYSILLKFPFDNYSSLKTYVGQAYVIHGTSDNVIPYHHSAKLKDSFPGKLQLTTINGSGHNDLNYYSSYSEWLSEALGDASKVESR